MTAFRHPVDGRDPFLQWTPAFAGVTEWAGARVILVEMQ
jgi:hypothetical protein